MTLSGDYRDADVLGLAPLERGSVEAKELVARRMIVSSSKYKHFVLVRNGRVT
jgi:hypothetical protein